MNDAPEPQFIVTDRASLRGPRKSSEISDDDKQERITAWLNQDQPFHGLAQVETTDRFAAPGLRGTRSTSCRSIAGEKGSDQDSNKSELVNGV